MSREKTPTKEKTRRNTKIHEKNRDEKSGVAAFFVIVSRFISFLCEKLLRTFTRRFALRTKSGKCAKTIILREVRLFRMP